MNASQTCKRSRRDLNFRHVEEHVLLLPQHPLSRPDVHTKKWTGLSLFGLDIVPRLPTTQGPTSKLKYFPLSLCLAERVHTRQHRTIGDVISHRWYPTASGLHYQTYYTLSKTISSHTNPLGPHKTMTSFATSCRVSLLAILLTHHKWTPGYGLTLSKS